MLTTRNREKLELIVDSCSMGSKTLVGVGKLIEHSKHHEPRIFDDYRVIIPIQIGAEKERRIFPDFLDAELRTRKPGYLKKFYNQYADHTEIVESEASLGFKLIYGACGSSLLRTDAELAAEIIKQSNLLADQYRPIMHYTATPTSTDLYAFLDRLEQAYNEHHRDFSSKRKNLQIQLSAEGYTGMELDAQIRNAEYKNLARHATRFFEEATDTERLLLQAMYSDKTVHRTVFNEREFKPYHFNRGERAIEDFLFGRGVESHPDRVTVIISEDQGARRNIVQLRSQSKNSIFAISSYGFAKALKSLKLIKSLYDIIDPAIIDLIQDRRKETHAKRNQGTFITMSHVTEPDIEEKWANRLVQVMRYGEWDPNDKPRSFTLGK